MEILQNGRWNPDGGVKSDGGYEKENDQDKETDDEYFAELFIADHRDAGKSLFSAFG